MDWTFHKHNKKSQSQIDLTSIRKLTAQMMDEGMVNVRLDGPDNNNVQRTLLKILFCFTPDESTTLRTFQLELSKLSMNDKW